VLTHEARLHAFGSASSPVAFARDLVPLFRGEPARDPAAHDQVCARITIEATEPLRYNLDGDLYDTDGTITVASGPAVRFVLGPGSTPIPVRGSGASSPRRP
jgi:diacylglycerol kinase family enzyme